MVFDLSKLTAPGVRQPPIPGRIVDGRDITTIPRLVAARNAGLDVKLVADLLADHYSSDDLAIQTAIAAAAGKVELTEGTFTISEAIQPISGGWLEGQGIGASTLQLAAGSAADVVRTEDFATLTGGSTQGGPMRYGIGRLTIDGNKANCPSGGWGLRQFGGAFLHHDFEILNCKAGGLWTEWGTGDPTLPAINANGQFSHFHIHDCDGIGLEYRGPHDSIFSNANIYRNEGACDLNIAGNGGGGQWFGLHVYGLQVFAGTPYEVIIDAGLQIFRNVVVECALNGAILIKGSGSDSDLDVTCYWGGLPDAVQSGITVGIVATDAVNGCRLKIHTDGSLTDGAIIFANDAGGNIVDVGMQQFVNLQGTPVTTGSTITTLDAENMPISGKLVAAESNVTGVILQDSAWDGAAFVLVNNSNFTIALDSGNVFGGLTMAAYSSQRFTYSATMGQWVKS